MLIDLSVAPDLSSLQIVTEVQYVSETDHVGRMGHMKFRISSIEQVQMQVLPGFHKDLEFGYGYKGNEIYEFTFEAIPDDKLAVTLRSDLFSLRAVCPKNALQHYLLS